VYISGTASIDNKGNVVSPASVLKQIERTVENVKVLLSEGEVAFDDVLYLIVYVRDIADKSVIENYFKYNFPEIPKLFVRAPVCRPKWLVEIECMAIKEIENS
jgi:enamine deaminase RidA (YjgF/YER057c/UK114 family)